MAFLGSFAHRGDPNVPGLPRWEAHTDGSARFMELGPALGMSQHGERVMERLRFVAEWLEAGEWLAE